jgi:hypothetical protein
LVIEIAQVTSSQVGLLSRRHSDAGRSIELIEQSGPPFERFLPRKMRVKHCSRPPAHFRNRLWRI